MKTYSSAMKSKSIIIALLLFGNLSCDAQKDKTNKNCNRNTVDKSITLPNGICLPDNFTADLTIESDFNFDSNDDIIIRYSKYPLIDGVMRHYSIFERLTDSTFDLKKQMPNLSLPYIRVLSRSYLDLNPIADSLVKLYPVDTRLFFNKDTLLIDHSIPDYYGKSYVFVYSKAEENWYLEKVRYWIGQLPTWLVKNANLKEELYGKVYLNEDKKPKKRISVDELNLIESKRIAREVESEYLMNNYDVYEWQKD